MSETNSTRTGVIYALSDSRSPDRIRYVGKTLTHPEVRLRNHLKAKDGTPKANWLKSLAAARSSVRLCVLEKCTEDTLSDREAHWIAWARREFNGLLNITDGGGLSGYSHSASTIQKMRKPKSPEHAAAISRGRKGGTISEPQRERIRKALTGRTINERQRDALMAAISGPMSEAKRKAISVSKSGKPASPSQLASIRANAVKRGIAVRCVETGDEFPTTAAAAVWLRSTGKHKAQRTPILLACKGLAYSAYGFHWEKADKVSPVR